MKTNPLLDEIEHITDIFTRVVLKTLSQGISKCTWDKPTLAQYQALRHIRLPRALHGGGFRKPTRRLLSRTEEDWLRHPGQILNLMQPEERAEHNPNCIINKTCMEDEGR
ncbi:MAG: hypothetical protein WCT06_05390 [Armatimonadota bacterium]